MNESTAAKAFSTVSLSGRGVFESDWLDGVNKCPTFL